MKIDWLSRVQQIPIVLKWSILKKISKSKLLIVEKWPMGTEPRELPEQSYSDIIPLLATQIDK